MEEQMNLTQNPLQSEATGKTSVVAKSVYDEMDPDLEKAKCIYDYLQEDIQRMLIEDYIKPQLEEGDKWIKQFHELIESDECSRLEYDCLIEPVTKIIQNETALAKMRKLDSNGFDSCYIQHFIKKQNTFRLVADPYISMCMEFVMRKWH
jgi:predicted transcriptional regulator